MKKPRFQVGQKVVVIQANRVPDYVGRVGMVTEVIRGVMGTTGEWYRDRFGEDWLYRLSCVPYKCVALDYQIRPYDPPADWTDDDMVWVPDALKDTEAA